MSIFKQNPAAPPATESEAASHGSAPPATKNRFWQGLLQRAKASKGLPGTGVPRPSTRNRGQQALVLFGAGVAVLAVLLWVLSDPAEEVERQKQVAAAAAEKASLAGSPNLVSPAPTPPAPDLTPALGNSAANGDRSAAPGRAVTTADIASTVDPNFGPKTPEEEREYWRQKAMAEHQKRLEAEKGLGSGTVFGGPVYDHPFPAAGAEPNQRMAPAARFDKDVETYRRDQPSGPGGSRHNVADLQSKFSGAGQLAAGASETGSDGKPAADGSARTNEKPSSRPADSHSNPLAMRSLLYVREEKKAAPVTRGGQDSALGVEELVKGSKLKARLLSAVSTDIDLDVLAVIEYAYVDENGREIIPAGSKAFGKVTQFRRDGAIRMDFDSIRKPDGEEMAINGVGVALNGRGPLIGHVGGKNTGKKILARTASGLGAAATLLFGRSGGFNGPLTYGDIARERVAQNIMNQGESAVANMSYRENITVTLPSNLRFEIILRGTTKVSPAAK